MSEKCDRCGSVGEDRRTLHMASFLRMDSGPIPFATRVAYEVDEEFISTSIEKVPCETISFDENYEPVITYREIELSSYHVNGEAHPRTYYTLRVCKRCRGEWMRAIREWFYTEPEGEDLDADVRL